MYKNLSAVYKGKSVFVTGHTGFKGAWLLKVLHMLGAEVTGYSLPPVADNALFNLIGGEKLCRSVTGNILDRELLTASVKEARPDFVFHLAAQPLVRESYEIPSETFDVNVIGSANVLDAVKCLGKPVSVVMITTDKVYANNEWIYPYRENDRLGGYDPYSASKACAELVIDSYRNSFFNVTSYDTHRKGIAAARAGNVIGGGDWAKDRLLPDIARALLGEVEIQVRNPHSVRPWQHVLEPLGGYLLLGERMEAEPVRFSQAYNFGPSGEDALPVESIVKIAIERWGRGKYMVYPSVGAPHEAGLLKLDISKAVNEIGWRPRFTAATAVDWTMSWYKHYFDNKQGIASFTESQIIDFLNG